MKQRDIVDAVNRLTAGMHVTWNDIKYDADKAILKINAYLGAKYPKMSDVLQSDDDHYELKTLYRTTEIFPEQYIHSIVIPFIASEILARDEEFTTIYNKYILEVEDGLFTMFSNEFNRVPLQFRQADTTGVFFTADTPQYAEQEQAEQSLPVYTYRIYYHYNNPDIVVDKDVLLEDYYDGTEYEYNTPVSLPIPPYVIYPNNSGTKLFASDDKNRWYKEPDCLHSISSLTEFKITEDLNLYLKWVSQDTLENKACTITNNGIKTQVTYVILKRDLYENGRIKKLSIPSPEDIKNYNYIGSPDGTEPFLTGGNNKNCENLDEINLPPGTYTVSPKAFEWFEGTKITFPQGRYLGVNNSGNADDVYTVYKYSHIALPNNSLYLPNIKSVDRVIKITLTDAISYFTLKSLGGYVYTVDEAISTITSGNGASYSLISNSFICTGTIHLHCDINFANQSSSVGGITLKTDSNENIIDISGKQVLECIYCEKDINTIARYISDINKYEYKTLKITTKPQEVSVNG